MKYGIAGIGYFFSHCCKTVWNVLRKKDRYDE